MLYLHAGTVALFTLLYLFFYYCNAVDALPQYYRTVNNFTVLISIFMCYLFNTWLLECLYVFLYFYMLQ